MKLMTCPHLVSGTDQWSRFSLPSFFLSHTLSLSRYQYRHYYFAPSFKTFAIWKNAFFSFSWFSNSLYYSGLTKISVFLILFTCFTNPWLHFLKHHAHHLCKPMKFRPVPGAASFAHWKFDLNMFPLFQAQSQGCWFMVTLNRLMDKPEHQFNHFQGWTGHLYQPDLHLVSQ